MKQSSEPTSSGRTAYGLESTVRQTAQALVRQWAVGGVVDAAQTRSAASPRPDVNDSWLLRNAHYDADAMMGLVVPSRWDAALLEHVEVARAASERTSTPRRVVHWFPRGGPVRTWTLTDRTQTPHHTATPLTESTAAPPAPADLLDGTCPAGGEAAPTYGLSEEELRYFGMLPPPAKHVQTPKALLMERLRSASRNVLPSAPPQRGSPSRQGTTSSSIVPQPPVAPDAAVVQPRANLASVGGVVIRSTRRVTHSADGSEDAHMDASPVQGVGSAGSPRSPSGGSSVETPSKRRKRGLTLLASVETPINLRFLRKGHCDATNVSSMAHMLAVTKAVMSERAALAAERSLAHPVRSIDCSGTRLGKHGRYCVPTSFHADGKPVWVERRKVEVKQLASIEAAAFWPDERLALIERSDPELPLSNDVAVQTCLNSIAERSLTLAYVAPLLYLTRPALFAITVLVARDCDLGDADAQGLAAILKAPSGNNRNKTQYQCVLEQMDLSRNHITDVGACVLKKAIKYAPSLRDLSLKDNPISNEDGVLNEIKRRLRNNKYGISNLGPLAFFR